MGETKKITEKVTINTGTIVGSQYSQLVGVSVTDVDITLEFVFINPRDRSIGQVVSRITLPIDVGMNLAKAIFETIEMRRHKKKGVKNG
ncbi:hypothetical protein A2313_00785 [Candidatus Roizmanbacteria bacterium RIFOXYB2_FULL_41_10]|uniref:Uncharacterized protein n=1 Tax=Candidatus Roizmanbacteria bacterium RIFOXYA1_FULL_41_12 TaxID=1802082 RepID=A0A1F7K978_9BACT|nr:MAG: hypothetical protein A2209_03770 [Candidatus Roizmanbacteria bacterium RIFOXYA1_FULL_41_12]OGK67882.1 MAG: hypothetical protein A2377_02160 [Candidatus Roizmanbacteria bacterium RIFOXYB1_FULL_41_27]OGK68243.1 MAG: hypothetical protein A2262_00210 [Candidatus Roizmanbacteria bacterium RIFOXYA2_FULL_41_8]OGK68862.1 MAG: hypothetical protein A2313_00785 [Candidatus Roizmanbacteria bacterium RIFOXYB2_FULL_41_10]OGK72008.1 MAG: hypothetical protein A2403_03575 [Candidatus Roizmanbacteria bac